MSTLTALATAEPGPSPVPGPFCRGSGGCVDHVEGGHCDDEEFCNGVETRGANGNCWKQ